MKLVQRIVVSLSLLLICGLLISAVVPNVPSGSWQATSDMASPRTGATATLFPDGRLMIVGGTDANGEPLATAEFYNADGSVSAAPSMSVARASHAAIFLYDGRLLVTGGRVSGSGITNSAEVFDPLTNHWQTLSTTLLNPRAGHTVSQLPDGSVLIAGGEDSSGPVSALEVFDLYNNFNAAGSLSAARKDHAAAVLPDGRVIIAGGTGYAADSSLVTLNTTEIYDSATNSVTAGPAMSVARARHSATTLLDGRVLIAGGNDGSNDLASAEIYNPATGAITATASMSAPRSGHTALLLPNNNAVLIAGGASSGNDVASAELYESWNNAFKSTGPMTAARTASAASATAYDGLAMLSGGSNLPGTELYGFATVKTDLTDYYPGQTVIISGIGWEAGETVALRIHKLNSPDPDILLSAVADSRGTFQNSDYAPSANDLGVKYSLTASGSRSEAANRFSDANKLEIHTLSITSPGGATDAEMNVGQTFLLQLVIRSNSEAGVSWSNVTAVLSGVPAGWTRSSDPSPFTVTTGTDVTKTWTITPNSAVSGPLTVTISGQPSVGNCGTQGTKCNDSNSRPVDAVNPAALNTPTLIANKTGAPGVTNVQAGDSISVQLTVTNNASSPAAKLQAASASALNVLATGTAVVTCAPANPASVDIAGGQSRNFNYLCTGVGGNGTLTFRGYVSGTDENGLNVISSGNGTSNVINVISDSTPPVITPGITGTLGTNGWYTSNVNVTWTVTDPESSISSQTGCGATNITADTAGTTLTCSATSAGGTNSQSVTIKRDATAPTAALAVTAGTLGTNDWYTTDVTVSTSGADATSGVSCTANQFQTTDTVGSVFNGSCTNGAGLTTNATPLTVKLDKTGPTATLSVSAGTAGANGWYTSDVTVSTTGSDAISGPVTCTADQSQTTETSGAIFNGSCTNNAGLTTNATPLTVKLDKTAPSASLAVTVGTLGANGWYTSDVTIHASGSDTISSPVNCTADQFQTTETTGAAFNGTCTNDAGLSTNATPLTIKLDKTGPTAALSVTAGTAGTNGWYTSDVTVSTTGTDNISSPVTCSGDQYQTTETTGTAFNGSCKNDAGLTTNASPLTVKLDKTPPSANSAIVAGTLGQNGWYVTDVTIQTSGTDTISSPVICTPATQSVTTDTTGITLQASCANEAGLSANANDVVIKLDKTAPSVTATPDRGADYGSWYNHAFTVTFSGTDATSDIASCDALTNYSGPDTSSGSINGNCKDNAGNTGTGTLNFKYDATAPVSVSGAPNRASDYGAWYNHLVDIVFTGSDATAGIESCSSIPYSGPDSSSITVNGSCKDNAGNTSPSVASSAFNYDATAPVVTITPSRAADSNGWYNHAVGFTVNGVDATSGVGSCGTLPNYAGPDVLAAGVNSTCIDQAGNTGNGQFTFNYDATQPVLSCAVALPVFVLNNPNALVSANVNDNLSGPASTPVSNTVATSAVGTFNTTLTGYDVAGNSSSTGCSYKVQYGTPLGFFQPWAAPPGAAFKAGSAIPLKWQYTDHSGVPVPSPNAAPMVYVAGGCMLTPTTVTLDVDAPGASGYTYDPNTYVWQFNWKTRKNDIGCYYLNVQSSVAAGFATGKQTELR